MSAFSNEVQNTIAGIDDVKSKVQEAIERGKGISSTLDAVSAIQLGAVQPALAHYGLVDKADEALNIIKSRVQGQVKSGIKSLSNSLEDGFQSVRQQLGNVGSRISRPIQSSETVFNDGNNAMADSMGESIEMDDLNPIQSQINRQVRQWGESFDDDDSALSLQQPRSLSTTITDSSGQAVSDAQGLDRLADTSEANAVSDASNVATDVDEVATGVEATGDALDATGVGAVIGVGLNVVGALTEIGESIATAFEKHKTNINNVATARYDLGIDA